MKEFQFNVSATKQAMANVSTTRMVQFTTRTGDFNIFLYFWISERNCQVQYHNFLTKDFSVPTGFEDGLSEIQPYGITIELNK